MGNAQPWRAILINGIIAPTSLSLSKVQIISISLSARARGSLPATKVLNFASISRSDIGCFPRPWAPLLGIAADDLDRHVITADLDLSDRFQGAGGVRAFVRKQFFANEKRRLDRRLCVILYRIMLDVGVQDLERHFPLRVPLLATQMWQLQRSGHQ